MRLPATSEDRARGIAGHIRPDGRPLKSPADFDRALAGHVFHDKDGSIYVLADPDNRLGKDR